MLKYSTGLRMLRRTFDSVTGNLTPPTTCTRKWGPCSCPVLLVTIRTTGQQVLLANQQNNRNKEAKEEYTSTIQQKWLRDINLLKLNLVAAKIVNLMMTFGERGMIYFDNKLKKRESSERKWKKVYYDNLSFSD